MRASRAFLMTSAYSYATMILLSGTGIQMVEGAEHWNNILVGMGLLVSILLCLRYKGLGYVFSMIFGGIAMLSFSGIVQWTNYYHATNLNLFMSAWDLCIGVSMLIETT